MKGLLPRTVVILVLVAGLSGCTQAFENFQMGPQGPGSNYEAYLTGDRKLVVELDHSPGAKWDTSTNAKDDFRQQLERITDKTVEIRASADLPDRGQDYAWSMSELRDLHEQHQDLSSNENRVVMHALFVDGKSGANADSVGVAYDADAFALFEGKIDSVSSANDCVVCSGVQRWKVMRAVSIHEAGHLLGLVSSPLPMVEDHNDDPENPAHSENRDSVMFAKVETGSGLTDLFGGGDVPWRFDSNDMADARAQRSGSS